MTNPQGTPQLLPGMAAITEPSGRMVAAVTATLEVLKDEKLLKPQHTATAQLCLELALAVEAGVASHRASAVALAARELREALATLPQAEEVKNDAFDQWLTDHITAPAARDEA